MNPEKTKDRHCPWRPNVQLGMTLQESAGIFAIEVCGYAVLDHHVSCGASHNTSTSCYGRNHGGVTRPKAGDLRSEPRRGQRPAPNDGWQLLSHYFFDDWIKASAQA